MSRIEFQSPQGDVQEGQRPMIIKLERSNEIGELLIEIRITGSQGHICYWDRGQRVSVYGGCPHGGKGGGDANRAQGCIQSASESGSRTGTHVGTVEQLRSISMQLS